MKLEPFLVKSGIFGMSVYNVYGSQNEFVERVTRVFIMRMHSIGQNGPLRRNNVFVVARIGGTLILCLTVNPLEYISLFWSTFFTASL